MGSDQIEVVKSNGVDRKGQVELERKNTIELKIKRIQSYLIEAFETPEDIKKAMDELTALPINEDEYQEYASAAVSHRFLVLEALAKRLVEMKRNVKVSKDRCDKIDEGLNKQSLTLGEEKVEYVPHGTSTPVSDAKDIQDLSLDKLDVIRFLDAFQIKVKAHIMGNPLRTDIGNEFMDEFETNFRMMCNNAQVRIKRMGVDDE